jgi:hypothetical protein
MSDDAGPPICADACIVAVPVTVLQRRHLLFTPSLPPSQQAAIDSIQVRPACKVHLTFSSPPWPTDGPVAAAFRCHPVHSVLGEGVPVPEVWFKTKRGGSWTACGFATGDYAEALCANATSTCTAAATAATVAKSATAVPSPSPAVTNAAADVLLRQLAPTLACVVTAMRQRLQNEPQHAATPMVPGVCAEEDETAMLDMLRTRLVAARMMDWAANPLIMGGYSAPSFGERSGARAAYRAPAWDGTLAFAGEASEDAMMTMNSAITSGRRAAETVMAQLGPRRAGATPTEACCQQLQVKTAATGPAGAPQSELHVASSNPGPGAGPRYPCRSRL